MNDFLSADLIPEIFEPASALLLVRISQVRLAPRTGAVPAIEVGTVSLQVIKVLRAESVQPGAVIQVAAHRVTDPVRRRKSNMDQWNNLALTEGENLLVAGRAERPPTLWKAVAAKPVAGPADPEVAAVGQALEIERSAPGARGELLKAALEDPSTLLRMYAIEALSRGKIVPKAVGVTLIAQAIRSKKVAGPERLDLGRALTRIAFFNKDEKAGGTNPGVLSGLAEGLVAEADTARKLEWARLLSTCFTIEFAADPAASRATRAELVRTLSPALAGQVSDALAGLSTRGTREEAAITQDLKASWQAAMTAP